MSHANACLTPRGRLKLARCVVEDGWSLRRAAERFQVSVPTAQRWAGRYRQLGEAGMVDRSSRPHHSPNRTHRRVERKIKHLRTTRQLGPVQIAGRLGLHASTVHRVITRLGLPRLALVDQATGEVIRRGKPVRYEHRAPVTWSTSTSRNSATSPTAAAGASTAAPRGPGTAPPTVTRTERATPPVDRTWATPASTTPSMTTPAWPTSRSWPTRRPRPRPLSGTARWPGSPAKGSSSTAS
jgi:hypothetical protein